MKENIIKQKFLEIERSKNKVIISIGEYFASKTPVIISTLLGSCVSVCLFDYENKIGGMNHIFLPGKPDLKKHSDSARYSVNAMELLINSMMKYGADKNTIIAKVFGGSSIFTAKTPDLSVGPKISKLVISFLKTERIKILGIDVGGLKSRKVLFNTYTGEVFLKRSSSDFKLIKENMKNHKVITIKGDITLF